MTEKKVLIVDDDPDLVEAVGRLLEQNGFVALAAYGGQEGLDKVREHTPDVVVLDVMMEDMDGFAVAKQMAADPELRAVPIIMLTAVGEHATTSDYAPQAAIKELEAAEWFDKPVNPQALLKRIKELVK